MDGASLLGLGVALCLAAGVVAARAEGAPAEALDCITTPKRTVEVAFGVSGIIASVAVERGMRVRAGQELARLDTAVEDAAIAIASARLAESAALESARSQLGILDRQQERTLGLVARQAATSARAEEIEIARIAAMKAVREQEELKKVQGLELERLRTLRRQRVIASPIDGVVVDRFIQPAEYIENRRAVTIAELDPIAVDVIVPAARFGGVRAGQPARILLGMPAGQTIVATVETMDAFVDGASGTFRVRLTAPNPDGRLVAGFPCKLAFAP